MSTRGARAHLALALACASLPTCLAAEAPALRVTLAEALERARGASAQIAQFRAIEDGADARLRGARADRLPEVELSAGYTRNSDIPEFSTPGTPTTPPEVIFPNLPDQFRSRLGLSVPLWTGGRLEGGIEAAEGTRRAASFDRATVDEDVVLETTVAYWSLVAAREGVEVLAGSVRAYEAHLGDAQARVDVGMAARNDVLAVQSQRDEAELARLRASSAARIAEANLARLLGVAAGIRIEPIEPVEKTIEPPGDVEALVAAAQELRFDRAAAASRVDAATARVRVEQASHRPRLGATAGYDYSNPNWKILPPADAWQGTWDVGVSLIFTVADGGRTAAAVDVAEAEVRAARQRLEALDRRIRLDVTRSALDLDTALASCALTARSLEAAQENVRVSKDRYREGLLPSSELLDAETALLRAGLARTNALVQTRVAAAELERASGRTFR